MDKIRVWRLIDKLSNLSEREDGEFEKRFHKKKRSTAKEIREDLRNLLEIPYSIY